jgi:cytochrome c-type biogenesis protein CcmH/NrfG
MGGLLSAVLSHKQPMPAATNCQSATAAGDTPAPTPAANSTVASTACNGPATAVAMAFLANILLTQGAVQQAVQLYGCAVQLCPESSQCVLGLVQGLEVQCDYDGALQAFLGFCRSNSEQQLGPLKLQVGV